MAGFITMILWALFWLLFCLYTPYCCTGSGVLYTLYMQEYLGFKIEIPLEDFLKADTLVYDIESQSIIGWQSEVVPNFDNFI